MDPINLSLYDLAQELLDLQHGSVEDAIYLAEDFEDEEMRDQLIDLIRELGDDIS